MISSKHFCDFCGLEIEKNESASILGFQPARMCVRSLLLKGCRSCTAPLDVEIWAMVRPSHLGRIVLTPCCRNFEVIICAIIKTRVVSKTSVWWLVSNLIRMPWLAKKCEINNQKSRASPAQTWIALVTLLATYKLYLEIFWTMAVARLQGFMELNSKRSQHQKQIGMIPMLVKGVSKAKCKQAGVLKRLLLFPAHIDGCGYIKHEHAPINTKLYNHKLHEISTSEGKKVGVEMVAALLYCLHSDLPSFTLSFPQSRAMCLCL